MQSNDKLPRTKTRNEKNPVVQKKKTKNILLIDAIECSKSCSEDKS